MKKTTLTYAAAAALSMMALVSTAQAQVIISEVAPFGSGSTYAADWFELTNTGSTAVTISGWKMDDDSNAFASAVSLFGISSIAAGQSVVFLEVGTTATPTAIALTNANFTTFWFGSNAPSGLAIGNYSGNGVGLSAGNGDAVNIFNSSGTVITRVAFGTNNGPYTFDNQAGLSSTVGNAATNINTFSSVGTNGAFTSFNSVGSIGSPAAVPEAEGYAMALAGLGALGFIARRRKA